MGLDKWKQRKLIKTETLENFELRTFDFAAKKIRFIKCKIIASWSPKSWSSTWAAVKASWRNFMDQALCLMSQLAELNPHPSSVMSRLTCCKCKWYPFATIVQEFSPKCGSKPSEWSDSQHPKWMLYPVSSNMAGKSIWKSHISIQQCFRWCSQPPGRARLCHSWALARDMAPGTAALPVSAPHGAATEHRCPIAAAAPKRHLGWMS